MRPAPVLYEGVRCSSTRISQTFDCLLSRPMPDLTETVLYNTVRSFQSVWFVNSRIRLACGALASVRD